MNGTPFTAAHADTLRRMAKAGYTDGEIARHLGRGRPFICRKRHQLQIERGFSSGMLKALARINMRRRCLQIAA